MEAKTIEEKVLGLAHLTLNYEKIWVVFGAEFIDAGVTLFYHGSETVARLSCLIGTIRFIRR